MTSVIGVSCLYPDRHWRHDRFASIVVFLGALNWLESIDWHGPRGPQKPRQPTEPSFEGIGRTNDYLVRGMAPILMTRYCLCINAR
jgi:hypothetical protein